MPAKKFSNTESLPHLSSKERAIVSQLISGMSQLNKKSVKQILSTESSVFHAVDITGYVMFLYLPI